MKGPILAFTAAVALALGAPAVSHADVDTDFANTLHTYGIYGQRDFNAWIAKLTCKRLQQGVDTDAYKSAQFVTNQLDRHSTQEQVWKFVGLSITTYCPEQLPVLQRAAGQQPTPPPAGPNLAAEQPS